MNNQRLSIEFAKTEQAETIAELLVKSIKENCYADHGNDPQILQNWIANKTADSVREWLDNPYNQSIVTRDDQNTVIGFAILAHSYEIMLNYIKPGHIGQGVGSQLLKRMEDLARDNDCQLLQTDSTVSATGFYVNQGFILNMDKASQSVNTGIPLYKYL